MIKVYIEKLPEPRDPFDAINIEILNAIVEETAEGIRRDIATVKCQNHPDQDSILRIIADEREALRFDKSGFCCQEFANQFSFERREG